MHHIIKIISLIAFLFIFPLMCMAQLDKTPAIRMRSEVQSDCILLRWIATDAESWEQLNKYGVRLERLTVARSGAVLENPEIKVLAECLKPEETDTLKNLVTEYPMGAVIAQAIFGENFEVSISDNSISKAISLDEMRHQRYLFSIYAADLCFPVAKEVGWGWIDKDIKKEERYLYRATSLVPKEKRNIEQGAVFVIADETVKLVSPIGLSAQFSETGALLSWDYNTLSYLYSYYFIERSEDGKTFKQISDLPVTRISDTDKNPYAPITYLDSIPLGKKMYYRVYGVTPFGSKGAYSNIVSGIAYPTLKAVPIITGSKFDKLGGADISWQFDNTQQDLISGFNILHSKDDKIYSALADNIGANERNYHIEKIGKNIYYKVEAKSKYGTSTQSPPVLIQPIDSVAPAIPKGLKANIDSLGAVHLSWDANQDADIYGYRLYRGQTKGEELIPITDIAIRETFYTDSVDINNLNDKVYYALTSLDERYNQSEQCKFIEVSKPNTITPTSPVITKGLAEASKNIIEWVSGGEVYLAGFIIVRKDIYDKNLQIVKHINNPKQTRYEDNDIEPGKSYQYQVLAYSINQLRSPISSPIKIKSLKENQEDLPVNFDLEVLPDGIAIKWNVSHKDIISITLYKLDDKYTNVLYRENLPISGEFVDYDIWQGRKNEYNLIIKAKGFKPISIKKSIKI